MLFLRLFSQDKLNWVMAGFMLVWMILMFILHKKLPKKVFCVLCELPVFICILHYFFCGFKGNVMLSLLSSGGFYLIAVIIALFPLLFKAKRSLSGKIISLFAAVICCIFTVAYPAVTNCGIRNYTHKSYVGSFMDMTKNMEEYYTLWQWKQTDIDNLRDNILPLVEEAEEKNDPALFYVAMCKYTYQFYDGHAWVKPGNSQVLQKAEEILAGNDYGFSLIRLTSGETVVTLIEDGCEAQLKGLGNGTRILKWNGTDINEAIDEVECIYTKEYDRWPVKANEEMFKPIFLAGKGGDKTEVTFITPDNKEQTITVSKNGSYRDRLERACEILLAKDKLKDNKNFETRMLSDTLGYLRISEEEFSLFADMKGYITGSNSSVRNMFDEKISQLQSQGMKKLVIDVRNNTGGYSVIALELASLFAKEDCYINSFAYINGEHTEIIKDEYLHANGKYSDMDVVVLTNCRCVSSGDYLIYCMSKCENVKTMGITASTCSSQPVGGDCVLTNSICEIRYPQNWMLDENGNRFIDTDASRECTIALDEVIPLTQEGVEDMFIKGIDYELAYINEN